MKVIKSHVKRIPDWMRGGLLKALQELDYTTQQELAEAIGVSEDAISRILTGTVDSMWPVTVDKIDKWLSSVGITQSTPDLPEWKPRPRRKRRWQKRPKKGSKRGVKRAAPVVEKGSPFASGPSVNGALGDTLEEVRTALKLLEVVELIRSGKMSVARRHLHALAGQDKD